VIGVKQQVEANNILVDWDDAGRQVWVDFVMSNEELKDYS
jgi:hypothetical protein